MVTLETAHRTEDERLLLHQVLASPRTLKPRSTYADWLDAQGDVRKAEIVRWTSRTIRTGDATSAPDFDELPLVWLRVVGATLLGKGLELGALDSARRLLALARPALNLGWQPSTDDLPVGATKLGGRADLPAAMKWPTRGACAHWMDDDDLPADLPCAFIGQLRLADIAQTLLGSELPADGMMSLFTHVEAEKTGTISARVVQTKSRSKLVRRDHPPEDDQGLNGPLPVLDVVLSEALSIPEADGPWKDVVGDSDRATHHALITAAGAGVLGLGGYFRTTSGATDPTPNRSTRRLVTVPCNLPSKGSAVHLALQKRDLVAGDLSRVKMVWMDWD